MHNIKIGKITRLGTSLALVIPKPILKSLKMQRGALVVFAVYDENIFAVRKLSYGELQEIKPEQVKF